MTMIPTMDLNVTFSDAFASLDLAQEDATLITGAAVVMKRMKKTDDAPTLLTSLGKTLVLLQTFSQLSNRPTIPSKNE